MLLPGTVWCLLWVSAWSIHSECARAQASAVVTVIQPAVSTQGDVLQVRGARSSLPSLLALDPWDRQILERHCVSHLRKRQTFMEGRLARLPWGLQEAEPVPAGEFPSRRRIRTWGHLAWHWLQEESLRGVAQRGGGTHFACVLPTGINIGHFSKTLWQNTHDIKFAFLTIFLYGSVVLSIFTFLCDLQNFFVLQN